MNSGLMVEGPPYHLTAPGTQGNGGEEWAYALDKVGVCPLHGLHTDTDSVADTPRPPPPFLLHTC